MNPQILRYITDNRDTYTREAITRRLIARGHDPAEIEQAWESIEPRSEGMLPQDRTFWRYFFIYIVALYGLAFVVYALRLGGTAYGQIAVLILGPFLLLGAGISILYVRVTRAAARGAASGLLIAALVPFMFLVIIAGACSMMVSPLT